MAVGSGGSILNREIARRQHNMASIKSPNDTTERKRPLCKKLRALMAEARELDSKQDNDNNKISFFSVMIVY